MAAFLDGYGVADARKESKRKRVILRGLAVMVVAITGYLGYLYFRTWSDERVMSTFFATLDKKDFQGAYRMWGCSQDKPCPNYDPKRFNEDWGPETPYSKGSAADVTNVDFCDTGVVFRVNYPNADPVSLWVEHSTKVISFAPWPRCPGRHLEIKRFFINLFKKA